MAKDQVKTISLFVGYNVLFDGGLLISVLQENMATVMSSIISEVSQFFLVMLSCNKVVFRELLA